MDKLHCHQFKSYRHALNLSNINCQGCLSIMSVELAYAQPTGHMITKLKMDTQLHWHQLISLYSAPECSWSKSKIGVNWKWMHMGSLCGCVGTCDWYWVCVSVTVNALKSSNKRTPSTSPLPPPCHFYTHPTVQCYPLTQHQFTLMSVVLYSHIMIMCAVSNNVLPVKELALFPVSLTVLINLAARPYFVFAHGVE